jgi:hypothetical protein
MPLANSDIPTGPSPACASARRPSESKPTRRNHAAYATSPPTRGSAFSVPPTSFPWAPLTRRHGCGSGSKTNAGLDVGPDGAASGGGVRGAGAELAAGAGAGGLPRTPEHGCPKGEFSYQTVRYPLDTRMSTAYFSNRAVQKSPSRGLASLNWSRDFSRQAWFAHHCFVIPLRRTFR